ncbi:signal transduction histidine kinase [Bacillus mesophilus]|uniref:histidine kinase n=1 Tax=Bacillus mesophilus TaxID=1808955 RepID=A0A6M0Q5L3_9BACI|nr:histidine kinase N-terminal domain-containing protein [Bacillus mesophilus]MBM7660872.1 signal transduction histidine kinase [Bacillus mesophilus]NEY71582.1 GHKL domain-containing protein [Bacillus mesophilus]
MTVEERLCEYLEAHYEEFLLRWSSTILISNSDPYKDILISNGQRMFELITAFLRNEFNEDQLKMLAFKVAEERAHAGVNIGEFIYNVNTGRSEIFKHLDDSQIPLNELQPIINHINTWFDEFIYHAVKKYTDIKDQDLNEKKSFIKQTHQDRLTLLGQMASSFVHEFRNPLTSITGFIKLLQRENPNLDYLDVIQHELEQLNYQISQFLLVSKKEVIGKEKEIVSFENLVKEVEMFLYPTIVDNNVVVDVEVEPDLKVMGYRDEFRQVLLNILMNSIDALKLVLHDKQIKIHGYTIDDRVFLAIHNNGPSIPSDKIISIFEPFITEKKLGTGLGLFVCKQIVEKHDGEISCTSTHERTSFIIQLNSLSTKESSIKKPHLQG